MTIPKGYIEKKGRTVPFGYELSEIQGYLKPIPEQLEVLHKYLEEIKNQSYSLREASALITEETGRKISHVALKNYIDKGPSIEIQRKKALQKKQQKLTKQKQQLKTLVNWLLVL